jgi:muramoyltetrapeptide carboxypeptidase LdcA involved in peptidoglycan recycling
MAEYPEVLPYTDTFMKQAWFGDEPIVWRPPVSWTEELLDFNQKKDLERGRSMTPNTGWKCLRPGVAEGPVYGGCFETICWHLKGSSEWLDLTGAILLIETSEAAPSPATMDGLFADLQNLGVFEQIGGLVMARPFKYDEGAKQRVWDLLLHYTSGSGLPILADLDCGHTDPMLTLPLGAQVRMDAGGVSLATVEPATGRPQ